MAVTNKSQYRIIEGVLKFEATLATQNDVAVFQLPRCTSGSVQIVTSNIGSAHLQILASNDGVTFAALPTTAMDFSAVGMKSFSPSDLGYLFYQAACTGATPTAPITVHVVGMENR